jgi:hypothetical protein
VLRELQLRLLARELEPQAHAPQLEEAAVADRGLLHQHAVDDGPVAAAEVLGPDALLVDQELAVEPRDGALVEQHVVERMAADGGALAGGLERLTGARSVHDAQTEAAHVRRTRRATSDAEGGRRVRVALGRGVTARNLLVGNVPTPVATGHPHPGTYLEHTSKATA